MTNGEVIETLFPNVGTNFSNVLDLRLWWNAPCKSEIKYKWEQTDKIEESNFSEEQYMADLKGAYDCGYSAGYADAMIDAAEGGW